ncbi:hypothetical protein [Dyella acidiphila]|uniref:DUF805 domain-containing protein n=1 Tax=Dyella acidiphila TaxID=2775866 RepID=A0ABR9GFL8_9GAMM|nr:hypothetical protein [Dyella acidiphila]MBE1162843.1 hypothetical protein [Dyella acidiphila]
MARYDDELQSALPDRAAKPYLVLVSVALITFSLVTCFAVALHRQLITLVLVQVCLPWLPIVLKLYFKHRGTAEENDGIVVGTLVAALFEIVALLLLASSLADLVHENVVLIPAALVGLLWLLGLYVAFFGGDADTRASLAFKDWFFALLLFGILAFGYGYAALSLVNRIVDTGAPDIYHSQIAGKYTTSGKSGTHYYLKLAGGPDPGGSNLQVGSGQYAAAQAGNVVCVAVYPGALGFRWMHSVACPDQASP